MDVLDKAEKGTSHIKRIFNFFYMNRQRREKLDKLLEQFEILQEEKRELQAQDLDFIKQLTTITCAIQQIDAKLLKLDNINEDLDMIKDGLQKSLLHTLRELHYELVSRNWCTAEEKKEFQETYDAYHALGKNGVADSYKADVLALPEKRIGDDLDV